MPQLKSVLDELKALLGDDAIKKLDSNPDLLSRIKEGGDDLYAYYHGEEAPVATQAPPAAAPTTTEVKTTPATTPVVTAPTVTTPTRDDGPALRRIMEELSSLNKSLDTRFSDFEKKVVTLDKVPEFRSQILASAIMTADDIMDIKASHKEEFGETFDRNKFNEFLETQKKANVIYPSIRAAYDAMVGEKRVEAKVAKAVAEAKKQMKSSAEVPGSGSSTSALSPVQTIIREAKKGTGEGKTNAQKAAERLAEAVRARDGGEAA